MNLYNKTEFKTLRQKLRKTLTPAERKLWSILKGTQIKNLRFFRQYSVGDYILDFYCTTLRLCIEADGGQHFEEENIISDEKRTQFLKARNIIVLRFNNTDILQNLDGVYDKIIQTVNLVTPPNLPLS